MKSLPPRGPPPPPALRPARAVEVTADLLLLTREPREEPLPPTAAASVPPLAVPAPDMELTMLLADVVFVEELTPEEPMLVTATVVTLILGPPPPSRPRPLWLPWSCGAIMAANLSAWLVPLMRPVRCRSPATT